MGVFGGSHFRGWALKADEVERLMGCVEGQTQEGGELETEASFLLLLIKAFGRPWLPLGGPRTRFPLGDGDVEAGSLPSWRGGVTCQHLPGNRSSPRPVLGGGFPQASQTKGQVVERELGVWNQPGFEFSTALP